MLAATENVDLIVRIDSDAGNFDERPAVWELLPALDHLELKFVRTIGHVGLSSSHQRLDERTLTLFAIAGHWHACDVIRSVILEVKCFQAANAPPVSGPPATSTSTV